MRVIPYVIAIALIVVAGLHKDWFELAWTSILVMLIGFDAVASAISRSSTRSDK